MRDSDITHLVGTTGPTCDPLTQQLRIQWYLYLDGCLSRATNGSASRQARRENPGILMRAHRSFASRFRGQTHMVATGPPVADETRSRPSVDVGVHGHPVGGAVESVNPLDGQVSAADLQPGSPWTEEVAGDCEQ